MLNLRNFNNAAYNSTEDLVGPLVDDRAPYSGVGMDEFKLLQPTFLADWNGHIDEISDRLSDYDQWQYGNGNHASDPRKILVFIMLHLQPDNGNLIYIRH